MSKKDFLKTLDIASFISAIIATVLVLVFQFTGNALIMKYAIVMYVVCFLALTLVLSFKVYFAFSKKYQEENNQKESENNDNNDSKRKSLSIVYLVLSSLALIFTFIMLILY